MEGTGRLTETRQKYLPSIQTDTTDILQKVSRKPVMVTVKNLVRQCPKTAGPFLLEHPKFSIVSSGSLRIPLHDDDVKVLEMR